MSVGTLVEHFQSRAREHPRREALRALAAGGAAEERALTWAEWCDDARAFAATLVEDGFEPGARVAVLAGNGLLWPVADLGVQLAGLVSVGVYPGAPAAQVRQLLTDCGAAAIVVDTAAQRAKVDACRDELPTLRATVGPEAWDACLARGRTLLARDGTRAALDARIARVRPDDDAALVYTSGSTGEPKGVRLSHRCLIASAESIRETLSLDEEDRSLAFLPFSHSAERVFGLATRIRCGMRAGLVAEHARVWDAARDFQPTIFAAVPRFFEKLHEAWITAQAAGQGAGEWRRAWLGGALRFATSGGAPLAESTARALEAAGVTVLAAYGLTEHLCVAFNRPHDHAFDDVGRAMPGTELRIAADGEVQVRRGPLTFSGYFARPAATAEAFTADGAWLRTGDVGTIDDAGRLRITGRVKELIALAAGKKVAPAPLESRLATDEWIGQAVCLGEGRRFLAALVTLRRGAVEQWAREMGIDGGFETLLSHDAVRARVQRAVDRVNESLAPAERIRRFDILERELTVEAGELTPTMKVRRAVVAERYRDRVEALYQ
ncbi:MAG: AMP-dependent synthetase/ligase [Gemmatimonadaceae bacterium]